MSWRNTSREPIGATCPQIDRLLAYIKGCVDEGFTGNDLERIEGEIEALRASNGVLRAWAETEADKVNRLERENGELEDEKDLLQKEIAQVRDDKGEVEHAYTALEAQCQSYRDQINDLELKVAELEKELEAINVGRP